MKIRNNKIFNEDDSIWFIASVIILGVIIFTVFMYILLLPITILITLLFNIEFDWKYPFGLMLLIFLFKPGVKNVYNCRL